MSNAWTGYNKTRWTLNRDALMPPTAKKWTHCISADMVVEYNEEPLYGLVPVGKKCFSCMADIKAPQREFIKHYQTPFLPRNWVALPEEVCQKFVDPAYYGQLTPEEDSRWFKYPEEIRKRCPDFHTESMGILAVPNKQALEYIQALINFRPILEGVRFLDECSHPFKKSSL